MRISRRSRGPVSTLTPVDSSIDVVPRRERLVAVSSLVSVAGLAWLYLYVMAADMNAAVNPALVPAPHPFDPPMLALTFLMWVVMMIGMMLPSATPAILTYGALVRKHGERGNLLPGVWIFAGGYLLTWTAFSVIATLLQAGLEHVALLDSAMTSASTRLSAIVLIVAGIWQMTPLKTICLSKCASPLELFVMHWRNGVGGALRMGVEHGAYCVGCCWALMLLLFVAGVMNLLWVAVISIFVLAEKAWPGPVLSRLSSGALLAAGVVLLFRA